MSILKVRNALLQEFIDSELFAIEHIAFENRPFNKPDTGSWASVFFLPASADPSTLGTEGFDMFVGIMQIDLNFDQNAGDVPIWEMVDSVRILFPVGKSVRYSGQDVTVRTCVPSAGRTVESVYRVSLNITFYSHVTR